MKPLYILALFLLPALMCTSCKQNRIEGQGKIETLDRTTGSFSGLKIEVPLTANIKIQEGALPRIQLKSYPNILEEIKTEVDNGVLRIYKDDLVHFGHKDEVTAEITVPTLNSLRISGAADVNMTGQLHTPKFNLVVSGAGDVKLDYLKADVFNATLSGAGDLEVNGGEVNRVVYAVTGAGEITSFPLQCSEAKVSVTGMGDVELSVTDKLDATVTGAGDINYKGHPQLSTNITGAGSVQEDK